MNHVAAQDPSARVAQTGGRGVGAWVAFASILGLPAAGLALLMARPELDLHWEHHPSHFWLVLGTAVVSVALAYLTNEAANRRADARLVLVSLSFMASAGFLGLHALATPGVLLPTPNAGFVMAVPVGLVVAACLAAASASALAGARGPRVLRHRIALRRALIGAMVAWAAVSLLRLPPLDGPLPPEEANGPIALLTIGAVILYAGAAWRYAGIYLRRRSAAALAIVVALVLLAEAMAAIAISRNWHVSWWEWHALLTAAYLAIAIGVRAEYRRTGSLVAALSPVYLESTLARIDHWHARAIAELAAAETRGSSAEGLLADLRRDGASTDEIRLLRHAASEVRRADELFRPYLPQQVAGRIRHDPALRGLGGSERTVTVLFADLAGFTTFSEGRRPTEVLDALNEYWAAVVPVIDEAGGSIEHFAGDGILALFNALADQPDHTARAARCALTISARTDAIAAAHPGWPRFRIGLNTGPAVVGNVGVAGRHSFTAIGDTTNLGSRLAALAEPGHVVIGPAMRSALEPQVGAGELEVHPLGQQRVKGKSQPVHAWVLAAARVVPVP